MAIKTETSADTRQPVKSYPKLMKSAKTGNIFLMISTFEGTIVHAGEGVLGHHGTDIVAGNLEDYNFPVTLENR